jgi:SHS2 domain-containing protein
VTSPPRRPRIGYEILAHTADTGISAYGRTLPEVFEQAARAMFVLMFGEVSEPTSQGMDVAVSAETVEDLLVAWLSELLFLSEAEELAFSRFEVTGVDDRSAEGTAQGVPYPSVELVGPPIKAVTYHQLEVTQDDAGWRARVIFDV